MGSPTVLQLGAWDALHDGFVAHPASPGTVPLDLNDGITWTLVDTDSTGMGKGLDLADPAPTIVSSGNLRARGERVTVRQYTANRQMKARLLLGQSQSYAEFVSALHTLTQLCEGISQDSPGVLKIQATGSSLVQYADVIEAHVSDSYAESLWAQLIDDGIEVTFTCRPMLRGPRQWLDNLAVNAGFELPSGPGVPVFNDPLTNTNAYAVQAGGALVQDKLTYADVVMQDRPVRYYRCDVASGGIYDATGNDGATSTAGSGITYGVTGLLTGDSDTAVSVNVTSGFGGSGMGTVPLSTGSSPWTLEAWFSLAALPGAGNAATLLAYGNTGTNQGVGLYVDGNNHLIGGNWTGDVGNQVAASSTALTTSTRYYAVGVFDGVHLTLYLNGAQTAQIAVTNWPSLQNTYTDFGLWMGAVRGVNGTLDELAIYTTALSGARVSAHYTAGTTAPTATANTLQIPSGGRVAFGSPAWAAMNTWQVRFRWVSSLDAYFFLHYTDANNQLAFHVNGTTLELYQYVAGVKHVLSSSSFQLTNGIQYWVRATQFPAAPNFPPYVAVSLLRDSAGTPGNSIVTISPTQTYDAVTALSGAPQLQASGAALGIGGNYASVHTVSLFGPGAWFVGTNAGTGVASGAWEQSTANTFAGGPVTSFGAARLDLPPAGTVDARWTAYAGGAPSGSNAIPAASSNILNAVAWVRSNGISGSAVQALTVVEYDASGNLLRSTDVATRAGSTAYLWSQLSGTVTTGASTAYVAVALRVTETSAGASANGTVWFDNVQLWNQTTTGMPTMPYCELRAPQGIGQFLVSGILGDVPAPAAIAFGAGVVNTIGGVYGTFTTILGRAARASSRARLVASTLSSPILDSNAFGGVQSMNGNAPQSFYLSTADLRGVYHLYGRCLTSQSSGGLPNVAGRIVAGALPASFTASTPDLYEVYGPWLTPFSQSSLWTIADLGLLTVLSGTSSRGALTDPSQTTWRVSQQYVDNNGVPKNIQSTGQILLPVDGSVLIAQVVQPSNNPTSNSGWLWSYADGLLTQTGQPPTWALSFESGPTPNFAHAVGGPGTSGSGSLSINPTADSLLTLDPTQRVGGVSVNQLAGIFSDQYGLLSPLHLSIVYVPLYKYLQ